MDEFPSNSRTPKPVTRVEINTTSAPAPDEERVYESVISGSVIRKKKGLGRRFMSTFFAKDSDSVGNYVLHEVLLPTLRDLLTNAVTSTVERAVYGDKAPPPRNAPYRSSSIVGRNHTSYNMASSANRTTASSTPNRRPVNSPSSIDIGLIVFDNKLDADIVAERLFDECRQYNAATVAALYGFMGQSSTYMDNRFGWDDLSAMHVIRQRDGNWLLDLPQPINLQQ